MEKMEQIVTGFTIWGWDSGKQEAIKNPIQLYLLRLFEVLTYWLANQTPDCLWSRKPKWCYFPLLFYHCHGPTGIVFLGIAMVTIAMERIATEKALAPHSSTLAWKSHGLKSLVGCSPRGRKESDMTERLHFHFSLSCIGEGSGNPLHCSCLENPRDGGAWWVAIYGVAQSRTWLKRLSSSSSSS